MVEKTKNVEGTWLFQGKEFKHCPKCDKGILASWTSHKCGWGLTEEDMEKSHIGEKFVRGDIKTSEEISPESNNKFWTNRVEVFTNLTVDKLGGTLNDFFEGRFVIATQLFPKDLNNNRVYDAVIYYKVSPK